MSEQLSDVSVEINDETFFILPNTLKFKEGFGEQSVRNQSAGNGVIDQVYSNDVETMIGDVKFEIAATVPAVNAVRAVKNNKNQNSVVITATTQDGTLTRSYANCALVNDYEVNIAADGNIELEFMGNRATV